ncbi:hypothetical protein K8Q93_00640 [Candidatus Parcubacteria bacterium]|nr:hypothetical protein [Candidatus Parcubacteria bacterium]
MPSSEKVAVTGFFVYGMSHPMLCGLVLDPRSFGKYRGPDLANRPEPRSPKKGQTLVIDEELATEDLPHQIGCRKAAQVQKEARFDDKKPRSPKLGKADRRNAGRRGLRFRTRLRRTIAQAKAPYLFA